MNPTNNSEPKQKLTSDGVKGIIVWYLMVFGAFLALIICSGTLEWLNAWVYLIVSLVYTTLLFIILGIKNPELLNERGKNVKEDTKSFDRVFVVIWMPLVFTAMAIMAWDAVLFQWSSMPFWTLVLGVGITIPAFIIGLWAMVANPYFELTVRIQEDRDHKVISSGPYKYIRHPGYATEIFNLLAVPFMLGSWWGFIPIGAVVLIFIIRTALEDSALQKELPGYKDYAENTRYRLFPYIW